MGSSCRHQKGSMMQIYSPLEEYRKSIKAASPDAGAILQKAANRALSGGLAGAGAMVVQVSTLMWMRTTMNYQYRHGGTTMQALKTIYKDGGGGVKGVLRFYKGFLPALVQGPLSRFGDTAANAGALALLDSYDSTKSACRREDLDCLCVGGHFSHVPHASGLP